MTSRKTKEAKKRLLKKGVRVAICGPQASSQNSEAPGRIDSRAGRSFTDLDCAGA